MKIVIMKNPTLKIHLLASALLLTTYIIAQTSQTPGPPKLDGSHSKDTSYSPTGASKNEVRGASGQGSIVDTDTLPPKKRKHPFPFVAPTPNNTNATNGSPSAPGQ